MALLKYRCPVCSYVAKNEGDLEEHIVERVLGKGSEGTLTSLV